MTSTDRHIIMGTAAVVGAFGAGDSYANIYSLARDWGMPLIQAALLPVATDGVVFASSWLMLAAVRQAAPGRDHPAVPLRARLAFWGGIAVSLAANGAYGYRHGIGLALLSVLGLLSYLVCTELLAWTQAHLGVHPKPAPARRRRASGDAPDRDASLDACKNPDRAEPLPAHLAAAEREFASMLETGKIPPLRELQRQLGIGQAKAQEIQAHFGARPQPAALCMKVLAAWN